MTKELAKYKGRETIQITTENYMEVMELIYLYPNDFMGKKVTYTGFVYNDPQTKGYQFIFRFGIIHCIADSGVYGLATTGSDLGKSHWYHHCGLLSKSQTEPSYPQFD